MNSFYHYLKTEIPNLTEQWYEQLDKSLDGVYGTTDERQIEKLKEHNRQFHQNFAELFNEESGEMTTRLNKWINEIATDKAHLNTPLDQIIGEFFNVQEQYFQIVQQYIETLSDSPTHREVQGLNHVIFTTFNSIISEFSRRNIIESEKLLKSQQEMILELSSPVITVMEGIAILPLVGDIDTHRAQVIFDKTLAQCNEMQVQQLVIDLSGVAIVDTMVASKIFQVIEGLRLIGTEASLTGIRPEIAQTAVQLGINFKSVSTYSSLAQYFAVNNVLNQ
ncbi:anti-anti-sigma regulatory factor [Bacillus sp. TS-2]|nr:anti-anti-sigma regulatory factor [Bacillus sp. TS-2]